MQSLMHTSSSPYLIGLAVIWWQSWLNWVMLSGIMDAAYFVSAKDLLHWINTFFEVNYSRVDQVCTGAMFCQILDSIFPPGTVKTFNYCCKSSSIVMPIWLTLSYEDSATGVVPLHKVNFNAKYHYEYIKNFNVLLDVFNSQKIQKVRTFTQITTIYSAIMNMIRRLSESIIVTNLYVCVCVCLGFVQRVDVERLIRGRTQENLEFLQWMKHLWDVRYKGQEYNPVERREQAMRKYTKIYKQRSARLAKAMESRNDRRRNNPKNMSRMIVSHTSATAHI